jgi:hypothetical protein
MAYTDIDKPDLYFNTKLYTGNGSTQSISGIGFQPDAVWMKERNSAVNHAMWDAVRGVYKQLYPNLTAIENPAQINGLTSFDADGFSVGFDGDFNGSGDTYVTWNWLASNTTASNTDGSITSTVSANTTSGFSIVSYTGTGANATVGHGLGAVPRMIIVKNRDGVDSWVVQHGSLGSGKALNLDSSGAVQTYDPYWNGTEPTTSVFSIGTDGRTNGSSEDFIGYCFAEKKGFSKFGSYTGNGNADGTFVYTGFKPAFVMFKRTDTTSDWNIYDTARAPNNVNNKVLQSNLSNAESTPSETVFDYLSNGFKPRGSPAAINASGGTYIYMAFAENPFVTSTGIPTTAR